MVDADARKVVVDLAIIPVQRLVFSLDPRGAGGRQCLYEGAGAKLSG